MAENMDKEIDYTINIIFNRDNIRIKATGEGITEMEKLEESAVIRHRHTKLVNAVNDVVKQYIKENQ